MASAPSVGADAPARWPTAIQVTGSVSVRNSWHTCKPPDGSLWHPVSFALAAIAWPASVAYSSDAIGSSTIVPATGVGVDCGPGPGWNTVPPLPLPQAGSSAASATRPVQREPHRRIGADPAPTPGEVKSGFSALMRGDAEGECPKRPKSGSVS